MSFYCKEWPALILFNVYLSVSELNHIFPLNKNLFFQLYHFLLTFCLLVRLSSILTYPTAILAKILLIFTWTTLKSITFSLEITSSLVFLLVFCLHTAYCLWSGPIVFKNIHSVILQFLIAFYYIRNKIKSLP